MGRKKIRIEKIQDERNRSVTFLKRKNGLMKKAMELSILCECQIALIIFTASGKMFKYASDNNLDDIVRRCQEFKDGNQETKSNNDLQNMIFKKEAKEAAANRLKNVIVQGSNSSQTPMLVHQMQPAGNLVITKREAENGQVYHQQLNSYSSQSQSQQQQTQSQQQIQQQQTQQQQQQTQQAQQQNQQQMYQQPQQSQQTQPQQHHQIFSQPINGTTGVSNTVNPTSGTTTGTSVVGNNSVVLNSTNSENSNNNSGTLNNNGVGTTNANNPSANANNMVSTNGLTFPNAFNPNLTQNLPSGLGLTNNPDVYQLTPRTAVQYDTINKQFQNFINQHQQQQQADPQQQQFANYQNQMYALHHQQAQPGLHQQPQPQQTQQQQQQHFGVANQSQTENSNPLPSTNEAKRSEVNSNSDSDGPPQKRRKMAADDFLSLRINIPESGSQAPANPHNNETYVYQPQAQQNQSRHMYPGGSYYGQQNGSQHTSGLQAPSGNSFGQNTIPNHGSSSGTSFSNPLGSPSGRLGSPSGRLGSPSSRFGSLGGDTPSTPTLPGVKMYIQQHSLLQYPSSPYPAPKLSPILNDPSAHDNPFPDTPVSLSTPLGGNSSLFWSSTPRSPLERKKDYFMNNTPTEIVDGDLLKFNRNINSNGINSNSSSNVLPIPINLQDGPEEHLGNTTPQRHHN